MCYVKKIKNHYSSPTSIDEHSLSWKSKFEEINYNSKKHFYRSYASVKIQNLGKLMMKKWKGYPIIVVCFLLPDAG